MKTTYVPAQVTTVEDTLVANLTLPQLLFLVAPIFISGLIYAGLSPTFGLSPYKLVLIVFVCLLTMPNAIRIRELLIASWLILLMRYWLRPILFVYDKNSMVTRVSIRDNPGTPQPEVDTTKRPLRLYDPPPPLILSRPNEIVVMKRNKKGAQRVFIQTDTETFIS